MIRSAEHVTWEAAMERGARDAELRMIAEMLRPFTLAARKLGIGFKDVAVSLSRGMADYRRAMQRLP